MDSPANPGADEARAFDLNAIGDEFLENPFPMYRALREHAPIHINPDGTYFLTRYDDVMAGYRHRAMSSDKKVDFKPKFGGGPLYTHHTTSLVFNDDPYHKRVRKLLAGAFSPRQLAALTPVIEDIVEKMLDDVAEMGSFDAVTDYALRLPTEIIADMLGVPEAHRHLMHGYSNLILGALDPIVPPAKMAAGHQAVEEFGALLADLIDHRRKHPGEGERGEVLAALIFGEIDGEKLSDEELVQNCIFLLNAGHETTASMVGHGLATLLENPVELRRLQGDPGLIEPAVEEFLRLQSPLQIGHRKATEDVEFSSATIPAGAFIHLCIAGANRDPEVFDDPENVDIGRDPNPQISFGAGQHVCMGNTLGRIEGRIAIGRFVERFAKMRQAGEKRYHGRAKFRGLKTLPMEV
ncbi:MAG: cytochrome P450 [Rhodospirillales bacterium]|nr:cytochrome P450 [Rhodospirillales bacterium]MDP6644565.1 cytochrome P450 [Rhodospirillales bacterium]MDP6840301.1 cytochrome P450 [Rhodospirillales bacterium]